MEQARNVRVLEVVYDWNDVGDWRALTALVAPDPQGNTIQGTGPGLRHARLDHRRRRRRLIATLGVDDLVIVQSGGATLVARKSKLDQLKGLVEGLDRAGLGTLPLTGSRGTSDDGPGPRARFRHAAGRRGGERPPAADRHPAGSPRTSRPRPGCAALSAPGPRARDRPDRDRPAAAHRRPRRDHRRPWRGTSATGWPRSPGCPSSYHDERYTTVEAEDALIAAGLKRSRRKGLRDMLAAQILLQNYLDAGCPESPPPPRSLDDSDRA